MCEENRTFLWQLWNGDECSVSNLYAHTETAPSDSSEKGNELNRTFVNENVSVFDDPELGERIGLIIYRSLLFQYYEMSYGLNVEMHKQVRRYICIS